MAQSGFTPILIYSSSTASNLPSASNLTNSTLGSELAINIADGKLFYKDTSNNVQVIGWKVVPTTAGGTGLVSYTAGDMLYYATGTTLSKLAVGATGTYMSSTGSAPQWTAPAALTKTDDTNVTLTLGGSASTALLNAASITVGWSGTLAATRGGTGYGSYAVGDLLYADTTTTMAKLADVATGNALISGGVGVAPSWGKIGLTTHVSGTLGAANGGTGVTSFGGTNTLLYTTATSTLSSIATANTAALITNSSGVPAWTSGTTANRVLRTNGTAVSFAQVDLSTDVTGVLPVANSLLYYNTNEKTMSSGSNYDWYSIDFGNFTGRSCRVEVVFSLVSGGAGSRIWYRNSLVVETGGASLSENNLNAVNGANGTLSFVLSGATLTVRTTTSGTSETARMAILVEGRDMTSSRISVL